MSHKPLHKRMLLSVRNFLTMRPIRRGMRSLQNIEQNIESLVSYGNIVTENIANTVCRKMSLQANKDIWTLPNGIKFFLPLYPWDIIQRAIVNQHQFFEQDMLEKLREYIPENATIFDIGANIGNHSVFWGAILNAKRIHAFEPIQETYRMLSKNIKINNLEEIIIPHNIALGDVKTNGDFTSHAENIGGTNIHETTVNNPYSLKIESLDDIGLCEPKIDFCKIDVEGFEVKTLIGMQKTLAVHKPIVFIECFTGEGHPVIGGGESNVPRIKDFFSKLGYQEPVYFPGDNWLFLPAKK